jgi:hypothetical protein
MSEGQGISSGRVAFGTIDLVTFPFPNPLPLPRYGVEHFRGERFAFPLLLLFPLAPTRSPMVKILCRLFEDGALPREGAEDLLGLGHFSYSFRPRVEVLRGPSTLIIGDGASPCDVVYECIGREGFWSGETLVAGDTTSPCDAVDDDGDWGGFWSGEAFIVGDVTYPRDDIDDDGGWGRFWSGDTLIVGDPTSPCDTVDDLGGRGGVKISMFKGDSGEAGWPGVMEPKSHIGVKSDELASVPGS